MVLSSYVRWPDRQTTIYSKISLWRFKWQQKHQSSGKSTLGINRIPQSIQIYILENQMPKSKKQTATNQAAKAEVRTKASNAKIQVSPEPDQICTEGIEAGLTLI